MKTLLATTRLTINQQLLDNSLAKLRYKIAMKKAYRNFGINPDELLVFRTPRNRKQAKRQTKLLDFDRRES